MKITINRWTIETLSRRERITRFSVKGSRGPYGAGSWYLTVFGQTVSVLRRYPDDRLRCQQCGYRRNDS